MKRVLIALMVAASGYAAPVLADPPAEAPEEEGDAAVAVIIYGLSTCPHCHAAESYMRSRGIPYVMKWIDKTPGAQAELMHVLVRSGQAGVHTVPVIVVGGQILVGFEPAVVERALARVGGR